MKQSIPAIFCPDSQKICPPACAFGFDLRLFTKTGKPPLAPSHFFSIPEKFLEFCLLFLFFVL